MFDPVQPSWTAVCWSEAEGGVRGEGWGGGDMCDLCRLWTTNQSSSCWSLRLLSVYTEALLYLWAHRCCALWVILQLHCFVFSAKSDHSRECDSSLLLGHNQPCSTRVSQVTYLHQVQKVRLERSKVKWLRDDTFFEPLWHFLTLWLSSGYKL